jgi:hypothetical protein
MPKWPAGHVEDQKAINKSCYTSPTFEEKIMPVVTK